SGTDGALDPLRHAADAANLTISDEQIADAVDGLRGVDDAAVADEETTAHCCLSPRPGCTGTIPPSGLPGRWSPPAKLRSGRHRRHRSRFRCRDSWGRGA